MPFYGLYIPSKNGAASTITTTTTAGAGNLANENTSDNALVFDSKSQALNVLKQHKEARLREFSNEDDAVNYALTGYEEVVPQKYADPKAASTAAVEKAAFRAPTKQELIEFRKVIESGDCERVKTIIWDNPRYLVSSGDTPTTLKEGYRYNALHVCAISKKPRIAELILKTVSDIKFVDLLTGKKNDEKMCKELCANLLDYYLNIPEKGRSETPLHFAVKIGSIEMVQVLTSYSECRMTRNNDGFLPKDIICSRNPSASPEIYKRIENLLEERFYVPVLRSVDNAIPPEIGEPFQVNNPPDLNSDPLSPEVKIQALAGPMSKEQAKQFRRRWKTPPRMGSQTLSPIANNPFISPRASNLNNTTPTKSLNGFEPRTPTATLQKRALFNSSPSNSPMDNKEASIASEIIADTENGNQRSKQSNETTEVIIKQTESLDIFVNETNNNTEQGRVKAQDGHFPQSTFCPDTPLLRFKKTAFFTYRDPHDINNSPVVFDAPGNGFNSPLNDSIGPEQRDYCVSPGYKERHVKISDTEKGLEVIGRELAREKNIEWREYWDFLDSFIDITSTEGLQKLENHLSQRVKEAESAKAKTTKTMASSTVALDDVCSALEKFGFSRDANAQGSLLARNGIVSEGSNRLDSNSGVNLGALPAAPPATTPYTCVEKSLQVFAKRMTKTIIHNIENVICINDTLLSELKRLKSLICSFKEDSRFVDVNFAKVHSRIGNLISIYLQSSQEVTIATKAKILVIVKNLQTTPGERREHIECLCARIFSQLADQSTVQIMPENLKTEELCAQAWLDESECDCLWDSNLSRKTSRRSRMEARYKSHQQMERQKSLASQKESETDGSDWRSISLTTNDSSDEDVYWSDFGDSDTENDDIWYTPSATPSRVKVDEEAESESYSIYVYGKEPTKRDLDVLNAILHVEVDSQKYPNILAWKSALLRFPNDEMEYFPSPSIVKKSHSFVPRDAIKPFMQQQQQQLQKQLNSKAMDTSSSNQPQSQSHLSTAKRLFGTPVRSKMFSSLIGDSSGPPKTPLNKLRGLFSSYRDTVESSPLPSSPGTSSSSSLSQNHLQSDELSEDSQ